MALQNKALAPSPDFVLEQALYPVCGIDEAGRAPLAGPVVAACVYVPPEKRNEPFWQDVKDSKKLSLKKRESLIDQIKDVSCFGIGQASHEEIDTLNIHHATLLAMKRAFESMCSAFSIQPEKALIDGKFAPRLPCAAQTIIKGDNTSRSIAAASIIAKVTRDRLMTQLHEDYPYYDWHKNAGYPTPAHLEGLTKHGITPHHRRSFAPVRTLLEESHVTG